MKLVKENIGFKRGEDPHKVLDVGKDSDTAKQIIFDSLIKKGVQHQTYRNLNNNTIRLDFIYNLELLINKLISMGVAPEKIIFDNVSIKVFCYVVKQRVSTIGVGLTYKDALFMKNLHDKIDIRYGNIEIGESHERFRADYDIDEDFKKFDGILETRKLYNI